MATDPLHHQFPIVDKDGLPTMEFQRKFNAQRDTNTTVTADIAAALAAAQAAQAAADAAQETADGKPDTFLELDDTPSTYAGGAGKAAVVNAGETGLEFAAVGSVVVDAEDVVYDNEISDLTAINVQDAIDEMVALLMHVDASMTTYRGHPVTCDRTVFTCDRGYF